ncbi:hypothetical protein D3C76_796140 [compost metagenome]
MCAALEHHFRRTDLLIRGKHRVSIGITKQRLFVIHRQQRQVDIRQHTAICRPGVLDRCPKPWPVVVVEHDPRIALAGFDQGFQQFFPTLRTEYRQGDAAEVQHIIIRQRGENRRGGRGGEAIADGRFVAPVQKASLTGGVSLDAIQTRQASGQTLDHGEPDIFRRPTLAHRVAETVIAQGGDVVHGAVLSQFPGQVHGRVQCIAAEALLQAAVGAMLQLDHALADQGDAWSVGAQGVDGVHTRVSLFVW